MAAPYASAAAAVLAAHDLDLLPIEIRDLLERSAVDLGAAGRDDHFGAGLIDPGAALTLSVPLPSPPALDPVLVAPAPAPSVTQPPAPAPVASQPIASQPIAPAPETTGYWVVAANGRVHPFGSAPALGDASRLPLTAAVVAAAVTPTGRGYWLTTADGAVFAFGDASLHGSTQALRLNAPIVGIAATGSGRGYWLLGRDGGIFSFGDASFYGSTGGMTLNQPVVDMAATPSGRGYWLVATDGGVFSFGDARFHGSTGAIRLNRPVVSLTPSTDGGYWMVATDGGIFAFDVPYHGSLPGLAQAGLPNGHRIQATPGGTGYYILGANGRVFPFGAARHYGSPLPHPVADLILSPSASTRASSS